MITYNSKAWFGLIFKFHKSDTFRILFPVMISVALYSGIIAYLKIDVFGHGDHSTPVLHTLLGFVISLLLAFRTNTAYERWWEGRKAWGTLVNSSRNLALKLNAMLGPEDSALKAGFAELISSYAEALKEHLRIKKASSLVVHKPNMIAGKILSLCNEAYKSGKISGEQLLMLNNDLTAFTDVCGICERIKKTPIPYSYSLFIKKFIFAYIITMPFSFVKDFGYGVILAVPFVFYVLASLELIAEEIEDPFGLDANDLPTDEIAAGIKISVDEAFFPAVA